MPGDTPTMGDAVWVKSHQPKANGIILFADEEEDAVIVRFHDEEDEANRFGEFTWEEFKGTWTDRFGGQYRIFGRE